MVLIYTHNEKYEIKYKLTSEQQFTTMKKRNTTLQNVPECVPEVAQKMLPCYLISFLHKINSSAPRREE